MATQPYCTSRTLKAAHDQKKVWHSHTHLHLLPCWCSSQHDCHCLPVLLYTAEELLIWQLSADIFRFVEVWRASKILAPEVLDAFLSHTVSYQDRAAFLRCASAYFQSAFAIGGFAFSFGRPVFNVVRYACYQSADNQCCQ